MELGSSSNGQPINKPLINDGTGLRQKSDLTDITFLKEDRSLPTSDVITKPGGKDFLNAVLA
jgi:hypothetical protein